MRFELRSDGPDRVLGNSDDGIIPLSVDYQSRTTTIGFSDLPEGTYRLTVRDTIQDGVGFALDGDANGMAGGDWTRDLIVMDSMTAGVEDLPPLLDINAQVGDAFNSPGPYVVVNEITYFVPDTQAHGTELWRTDGTVEGTVLVKDIAPGAASSSPFLLTNVSGTLYFVANDGVTGNELWKSDGTPAGTTLVKDIVPGTIKPSQCASELFSPMSTGRSTSVPLTASTVTRFGEATERKPQRRSSSVFFRACRRSRLRIRW